MEQIRNKDLQPWHTFSTPTTADKVLTIESKSDLKQISNLGLDDFYILGGGSNILPVGDIKKPILKNELKGIKKINETKQDITIKVNSGENWHQLVKTSVHKGFGGLENLALIPGTVGGAIIQNAGAYGAELKDVIQSVQAYDLDKNKMLKLNKEDCEFGYRFSAFKKKENKHLFVVSGTFKLRKNAKLNLDYKSLSEKLDQKSISDPSIKDVFETVKKIRDEKLPDWNNTPTAGSFFKNPFISIDKLNNLQESFPDIPNFNTSRGIKLSAGWLIEQIEKSINPPKGVDTYNNHSLIVINPGKKSGQEVYNFINTLQQRVKDKFDIKLNKEVKIW